MGTGVKLCKSALISHDTGGRSGVLVPVVLTIPVTIEHGVPYILCKGVCVCAACGSSLLWKRGLPEECC